MLANVIAFLALAVSFGAMYFAGAAATKAEFQRQQFYDAHIKGIKSALNEASKTLNDVAGRLQKLEKGDSETLKARIDTTDEKLKKLTVLIESLAKPAE